MGELQREVESVKAEAAKHVFGHLTEQGFAVEVDYDEVAELAVEQSHIREQVLDYRVRVTGPLTRERFDVLEAVSLGFTNAPPEITSDGVVLR